MRDLTRRGFLTTSAAVAGLLAGCPSDSDGTASTPSPTPTPTPTPAIPADAPEYWSWLPAPAALDVDRYSVGAFDLEPMREAGAANRLLDPRRFAPEALEAAIGPTERLLTLSNSDFGTGLLFGDYDVEAIGQDLQASNFDQSGGTRYTGEDIVVDLSTERIDWADRAATASATVETMQKQVGNGETPYPAANSKLRRALETVEPAEARFALEYRPQAGANKLEGARYHANGMQFKESSASWHIAVVYAEAPPEGAARAYREVFEDKQGFTDIRTRVDGDLLELEVSTSPIYATSTQPF